MNTIKRTNRQVTTGTTTVTELGFREVLHRAETRGNVVERVVFMKIEQPGEVRFEKHHFVNNSSNHILSHIRTYDIDAEAIPSELLS